MRSTLLVVLASMALMANAEVPEDLSDLQTEFYLPYSETEDVDFSLQRPVGYGCYQWSTENTDEIRLAPLTTDSELMCGNTLEFQVLPKGPKEVNTFKIIAENVKLEALLTSGTDDEVEIPAIIEYTIHLRPVAKMEILGLKTELVAGAEPAPFGVSAFDAQDNEFDTLDGLQIKWFIGSKRNVADFLTHHGKGPIIKIVPTATGAGKLIALLDDPNYKEKEGSFAILDFTVTSSYVFEPSNLYLLEHGKIALKVMEPVKVANTTVLTPVVVGDDDAGLTLEVRDPDVVRLDDKTGNMTALKEGETYVFLKNSEGEVVKGMPIFVTTAHKVNVTLHPHPESRQLIKNNEFDLHIDIFNKEEKKIYPSENIVMKVAYPAEFITTQTDDDDAFHAKVIAAHQGLARVKVSLRSVLTDDDEEEEIVPHVKGTFDFEVYEPIVIKSVPLVIPWDESNKPSSAIAFKAEGGSKTYDWSVSDENLATVNNEGVVETIDGPGEFAVKASMPGSPHNFDQVKVYMLPPLKMEIATEAKEIIVDSIMHVHVQMTTLLPETAQEVVFTDCSRIPYDIHLSDEVNFKVVERADRKTGGMGCTHFVLKALNPGFSTDVTVSFFEESTGKTLRAETTFFSYSRLEVVQPRQERHAEVRNVVRMPVGGQTEVILKGGPLPWPEEPEAFYTHIEVENDEMISVVRDDAKSKSVVSKAGDYEYTDTHFIKVTCLALGEYNFAYQVGNTASDSNELAQSQMEEFLVECSQPSKIIANVQSDSMVVTDNEILVDNSQEFELVLTVKNEKGKTFETVNSLSFGVSLSDQSLAKVKESEFVTPEFVGVSSASGKPYRTLVPQGKSGDLELKVKLSGYQQQALDKAGIRKPADLPKVLDDDDDDEDEESEEEYQSHHHSLVEYIQVKLVSPQELQKLKP